MLFESRSERFRDFEESHDTVEFPLGEELRGREGESVVGTEEVADDDGEDFGREDGRFLVKRSR